MKKIEYNIPVSFFKEGESFIAFSPVLDLSTCGKTFEQAKKRFEEASEIFFEELKKKGTLQDVLMGLGWQKNQQYLMPPVFVAQECQSLTV